MMRGVKKKITMLNNAWSLIRYSEVTNHIIWVNFVFALSNVTLKKNPFVRYSMISSHILLLHDSLFFMKSSIWIQLKKFAIAKVIY